MAIDDDDEFGSLSNSFYLYMSHCLEGRRLPSNFCKNWTDICCPQKTLLFHLGVWILFYFKINILQVMIHLTQLHWIKTLLERKIFCTTLIPTLNFNYSFM